MTGPIQLSQSKSDILTAANILLVTEHPELKELEHERAFYRFLLALKKAFPISFSKSDYDGLETLHTLLNGRDHFTLWTVDQETRFIVNIIREILNFDGGREEFYKFIANQDKPAFYLDQKSFEEFTPKILAFFDQSDAKIEDVYMAIYDFFHDEEPEETPVRMLIVFILAVIALIVVFGIEFFKPF